MNKPLHLCLVGILLSLSGMLSGQNTVKLFNGTNNKELFVEVYHYNTTTYSYYCWFERSSPADFRKDMNPFRINRYEPRKSVFFTNNLNEYILHQDSVQIETAIKDSLSPILILQFLKEELETRGIATQYPVKDKQPAAYTAEISACECRYNIHSLMVPKGKKKFRYTGNYQVEYIITWKERKNNQATPEEDQLTDHIAFQWDYKPKTDMKDLLPGLSATMAELCLRIARTKAAQIADALKGEKL